MYAYCLKSLYTIKHYWKIFLGNSIFSLYALIIQLALLRVFLTEEQIWNKTVVYILLSTFIGGTVSLYREPVFSTQINSGAYVVYGIRPLRYYYQFICEELCTSLSVLIYSFPLLLAACGLSYIYSIQVNPLWIVSYLLALILSANITVCFYSLSVILQKNTAVRALLQGIASLLSGSLLPLVLWPHTLVILVQYLPFAAVIHAPIAMYLHESASAYLLFSQLGWIIIFFILNRSIVEYVLSRQQHIGG